MSNKVNNNNQNHCWLFTDASTKNNGCCSFVGGLAALIVEKPSIGLISDCIVKCVEPTRSSNFGLELQAALLGIRYAFKRGYRLITVCSDSIHVVRYINGEWGRKKNPEVNAFLDCIDKARAAGLKLRALHVKGHQALTKMKDGRAKALAVGNSIVDRFAKKACSLKVDETRCGPPSSIGFGATNV